MAGGPFYFGQRPIFAASPEEFKLTLEWSTAVAQCLSGEYRRALSDPQPAAKVSASGKTADGAYIYAVRRIFETSVRSQEFWLPFWPDKGSRVDASTIMANTTNSKWRANEPVLLWRTGGWEVGVVDSVTPTSVTLQSPSLTPWESAAPLVFGQMTDMDVVPQKQMLTWSVVWREDIAQEDWITPADSILNGLPVQPGGRTKSEARIHSVTSSGLVNSANRLRNLPPFRLEYSIDSDSDSDYRAILGVLAYRRGKLRAVATPSYQADLRVRSAFPAGSTTVVVEDLMVPATDYVGATYWYAPSASAGFDPANTLDVVAAASVPAGVELTLGAPLPVDLPVGSRISREYSMRLDTDTLVVEFRRWASFYITMPMVEVV